MASDLHTQQTSTKNGFAEALASWKAPRADTFPSASAGIQVQVTSAESVVGNALIVLTAYAKALKSAQDEIKHLGTPADQQTTQAQTHTVLLLESRVVEGVAEFALARPDGAAGAIARLLLQPPAVPDTVVRRQLEWMSPAGPDREATAERRILLVGDQHAAIVEVDADGGADEPVRIDEDGLTALLGTLMARRPG